MFKPSNYDEAEPKTFGNNNRPPAGPYVMRIVSEKEIASKKQLPMLQLELDIAEGEYSRFFFDLGESLQKPMFLRHYRLLTEEQSNYLKGDISSIERSNNGFKYNFSDGSLIGKLVGANLLEEEYDKDGEIRTSLKIGFLFPIPDILKIKPMAKKCLVKNNQSQSQQKNDGCPF